MPSMMVMRSNSMIGNNSMMGLGGLGGVAGGDIQGAVGQIWSRLEQMDHRINANNDRTHNIEAAVQRIEQLLNTMSKRGSVGGGGDEGAAEEEDRVAKDRETMLKTLEQWSRPRSRSRDFRVSGAANGDAEHPDGERTVWERVRESVRDTVGAKSFRIRSKSQEQNEVRPVATLKWRDGQGWIRTADNCRRRGGAHLWTPSPPPLGQRFPSGKT